MVLHCCGWRVRVDSAAKTGLMRQWIAHKGALPLPHTSLESRSSSASALCKRCVTSDTWSGCVVSSFHSRRSGCGRVFGLCLRHAAALPLPLPLRGRAAAAAAVDAERRVVADSGLRVGAGDAAVADLSEGGVQQTAPAGAR